VFGSSLITVQDMDLGLLDGTLIRSHTCHVERWMLVDEAGDIADDLE